MDKAIFRLEIGFEPDPKKGRFTDPDLSASWGWFQIFVDEVNLCKHVAGGQMHDRVHWFLLPLIEWWVEHWDQIFHESRIPEGLEQGLSARDSWIGSAVWALEGEPAERVELWRAGHSLRAASEGGLFPDLFVRRFRDDIEFSWGHTHVIGGPSDLRFLTDRSVALTPTKATAKAVRKVLADATDILLRTRSSGRIAKLSKAIDVLGRKRREPARMIAGWSHAQDWMLNYLEDFQGLVMVPSPQAYALYGSLSPSVAEDDVKAVQKLLKPMRGNQLEFEGLEADTTSRDPWEQGYELAEKARTHFALADDELPDLDKVLSRARIRTKSLKLTDVHIRAIALCGRRLRPTIAVNESCEQNATQPGRRFTLAHELCHLLFDQEAGIPLAVASGPWAPRALEQRANAFAAMFLMPLAVCRRLVQEFVGSALWSNRALKGISKRLGTGRVATREHLTNLGLLDKDVAFLLQLAEP